MKTKKPKLLFNKSSLPWILEALGKSIDNKNFIIDIKTKEFVLDPDGKKIKSNKLIGIIGKDFVTDVFQVDPKKLYK